jgi:hypothetical protein
VGVVRGNFVGSEYSVLQLVNQAEQVRLTFLPCSRRVQTASLYFVMSMRWPLPQLGRDEAVF